MDAASVVWNAQTFLVFLTHHCCPKNVSPSPLGATGSHSPGQASSPLNSPLFSLSARPSPVPAPGESLLSDSRTCFVLFSLVRNLLSLFKANTRGLRTASTIRVGELAQSWPGPGGAQAGGGEMCSSKRPDLCVLLCPLLCPLSLLSAHDHHGAGRAPEQAFLPQAVLPSSFSLLSQEMCFQGDVLL